MTLIIAAKGKRSIWLAADNRLSHPNKTFTDSGCKIFNYDCKDARSIIGYCGLGMTAAGVEPSEWMERVLRGSNKSWIDGMKMLCSSCFNLLPHLHKLSSTQEFLLPTLRNKVPHLYEIVVNNICARLAPLKENATSRGSGSKVLRQVVPDWTNHLRKLINGYEEHRLSADLVMKEISILFTKVGSHCNSVSETCDVKYNDRSIGGTSQMHLLRGEIIGHSEIRGVGNGLSSTEMSKALLPMMEFMINNPGKLEIPPEIHDKMLEGLRGMDNKPDTALK